MKKSLSVLGTVFGGVVAITSVVEEARNVRRNIDGDGIYPTRGAIADVMGMDTHDLCYPCSDYESGYCKDGSKGWECYESEVADPNAQNPSHREFHAPDTIREHIATSVGNKTGFFGGIVLAVASVLAGRKKKTE